MYLLQWVKSIVKTKVNTTERREPLVCRSFLQPLIVTLTHCASVDRFSEFSPGRNIFQLTCNGQNCIWQPNTHKMAYRFNSNSWKLYVSTFDGSDATSPPITYSTFNATIKTNKIILFGFVLQSCISNWLNKQIHNQIWKYYAFHTDSMQIHSWISRNVEEMLKFTPTSGNVSTSLLKLYAQFTLHIAHWCAWYSFWLNRCSDQANLC